MSWATELAPMASAWLCRKAHLDWRVVVREFSHKMPLTAPLSSNSDEIVGLEASRPHLFSTDGDYLNWRNKTCFDSFSGCQYWLVSYATLGLLARALVVGGEFYLEKSWSAVSNSWPHPVVQVVWARSEYLVPLAAKALLVATPFSQCRLRIQVWNKTQFFR